MYVCMYVVINGSSLTLTRVSVGWYKHLHVEKYKRKFVTLRQREQLPNWTVMTIWVTPKHCAPCVVPGVWWSGKTVCVHHVGDEHTPIWVGGPAGPIWCGGGTASIDMLVCHCVLPAVYLRQPPSHHMTHTSAYPRVFSKVGWLVFG